MKKVIGYLFIILSLICLSACAQGDINFGSGNKGAVLKQAPTNIPVNTPTPTNTVTPTPTNTPTNTPTPTNTVTSTPTATPTPTNTPTNTPTPTPTNTPTNTPTPTCTNTPTCTPTPTGTLVMIEGFNVILQEPELPSGCEATAVTMVLNYYGFDVDKVEFVDLYLEKGTPGVDSPEYKFLGNPKKKKYAYGCYAPAIVKSVENYIDANPDCNLEIVNVSKKTLFELTDYIDESIPVIIWATSGMRKTKLTIKWETEQYGTIQWKGYEHCVVLVGYDEYNNLLYVADSLTGQIDSYDYGLFITRYIEQGENAVVILKNNQGITE